MIADIIDTLLIVVIVACKLVHDHARELLNLYWVFTGSLAATSILQAALLARNKRR